MADDCMVKYDDVQKKHKHRFVTFHIKDEKEIVVDKVGKRSSSFNDFVAAIQRRDSTGAEDCRYAILDYDFTLTYQGTDALQRDVLLLFMYCPEDARIRKKMIYSSTFNDVIGVFKGIKKTITINDESDLNEDFVQMKATQGLRI